MPFGIGWAELLLIMIIVLLLFGAKRLPEIAQGLGKGIREFKRAMKDTTEEVKGSMDNEGVREYDKVAKTPKSQGNQGGDRDGEKK